MEASGFKGIHSGAASSPALRLIENIGFAALPQCGRRTTRPFRWFATILVAAGDAPYRELSKAYQTRAILLQRTYAGLMPQFSCSGCEEAKNGEQRSKPTSRDWIDVLSDAKIKISMNGKGCWVDKRMMDRLWQALKYECLYLHAFEKRSHAKTGISKYMGYCNSELQHGTHGVLTPDEAYARKTKPIKIAA